MNFGLAMRLAVSCAALVGAAAADAQSPAPTPSPATFVKDPRYWPTPVMDVTPPKLPRFSGRHAVMIFSKTNGYRDDLSIKAADAAVEHVVRAKHWDAFVTENAAVFNAAQLAKFDVVVLNSNSGNVWTDGQRAAFQKWIQRGGAVVALHGAGGDPEYDWRWYVDVLLGAQFIGHTYTPQFQLGTIRVVDRSNPATRTLPAKWSREEEWYSFDRVPSGYHTRVLGWLDEASYSPPEKQRMGEHPIIWTRCIGRGRVFFSALGHKAETYSEPLHLTMIDGALTWAAPARKQGCS